MPKAIARRKAWSKFGASASDKPGPNPTTTTVVSEEIMMQFYTNKEEQASEEQSELDKLTVSRVTSSVGSVRWTYWTKECPYKDDLGAI